MRQSKNIFLFCLGILTFGAHAQEIDHFIDLARNNNPLLKSKQLEYQASLQSVNEVGFYPDPKLNLGVGVLPIETRLGAQRLKIGLSQRIPWPGSLNQEKKTSRSKAETKSLDHEIEFIQIEYAIRESYLKLCNLDEQVEVLEKRLLVLDNLQELAKSSVRSGKGQLSNVLLLERKITEVKYGQELLQKSKEQLKIFINRWTNRPLLEDIELVPSIMAEGAVFTHAIDKHPSILKMNMEILSSKQLTKVVDFQQKPKLTIGLDYSLITRRENISLANNGRDVLMPMMALSLPINKKRFEAKRSKERILQEALLMKIENQKNHFEAEIKQVESRIQLAQLERKKYKELVEITNETIDLMRTEYQNEGTRFEHLLNLEMDLLDYELATIKANYSIQISFAVLNKYRN